MSKTVDSEVVQKMMAGVKAKVHAFGYKGEINWMNNAIFTFYFMKRIYELCIILCWTEKSLKNTMWKLENNWFVQYT